MHTYTYSFSHLTHAHTTQTVVCKKEPPIYWATVAISPMGKAAALVDREGFVWGGSTDFKVKWHILSMLILYLETKNLRVWVHSLYWFDPILKWRTPPPPPPPPNNHNTQAHISPHITCAQHADPFLIILLPKDSKLSSA